MVSKSLSVNSTTAYSVAVGICIGAVATGVMAKLPLMALFKGLSKKDKADVKALKIEVPTDCGEDDSSVSSDNVNVEFMSQACTLATKNLLKNTGGPFGCVIVRDGKIIGQGANSVTTSKDPTCHAEMNAIRDACKNVDASFWREQLASPAASLVQCVMQLFVGLVLTTFTLQTPEKMLTTLALAIKIFMTKSRRKVKKWSD